MPEVAVRLANAEEQALFQARFDDYAASYPSDSAVIALGPHRWVVCMAAEPDHVLKDFSTVYGAYTEEQASERARSAAGRRGLAFAGAISGSVAEPLQPKGAEPASTQVRVTGVSSSPRSLKSSVSSGVSEPPVVPSEGRSDAR